MISIKMQLGKNTQMLGLKRNSTLRKMLEVINDDLRLPNLKRTVLQLILKVLNFSYFKIYRNSA